MVERRAFAPATVANVGPGFDIFGFAIEGPGDEVSARLRDEPGVHLVAVEGDGGVLPREADRNTAGVAVRTLLAEIGESERGVELVLKKGMPLSSGLGSSAASAVAAVVAVNSLLSSPAEPAVLLRCATEAERAACGFAHADNVAPSLLGGFVLVRGRGSPRVDVLPVPDGLTCGLLHPHQEIRTGEARSILPKTIPLAQAVRQWGNVAALVAALFRSDHDLLESALEDFVAEPVRGPNVRGFEAVRAAARGTGALGCGLSGSGPSIFALCRDRTEGERVVAAMANALEEVTGDRGDTLVSPVGAAGARVLAPGTSA